MLVGGTLVVVAAAALAAVVFTRRRSHDEVHSVEGYHRQLHTLESMNGHPARPDADPGTAASVRPAYPESAVRLAGTPTVRITEGAPQAVPPVPLPPAAEPVAFDDEPVPPAAAPTAQSARASRRQDQAMSAMNHRPRRLGAPAAAVGGVTVLIVVLLVVGAHSVGPRAHSNTGAGRHTTTSVTVRRAGHHHHRAATSTTTTMPIVSLPSSSSANDATYNVAGSTFVLALSATTGPCWVQVTDSSSGATLYAGILEAGGQRTVNATGPLTVEIGAPSVFAASVDGSAVTLPTGFQTPLTLRFVTSAPATTSTSTTS